VTALLRRVLDIRRHPLGPRVYLVGRRVHECTAGVIAVAVLALLTLTHHAHHHRLEGAVGLVAVWMIAKDWPDFFPSRRDTYGWRLGLHRRGDAELAVTRSERDPA
jgi:hypothetical protein